MSWWRRDPGNLTFPEKVEYIHSFRSADEWRNHFMKYWKDATMTGGPIHTLHYNQDQAGVYAVCKAYSDRQYTLEFTTTDNRTRTVDVHLLAQLLFDDSLSGRALRKQLGVAVPEEPCQRKPQAGYVISAHCVCDHAWLVHDSKGCALCAMRVAIEKASK